MAKRKEYIQLDLIPPTELEKMYAEFLEVKTSSDKVRRGIFAKHTELSKKCQELTCQVESLQAQLVTLSSWVLSRLGSAVNVQCKPEEHQETVFLPTTKINVTYANKLYQSRDQETTDALILSA